MTSFDRVDRIDHADTVTPQKYDLCVFIGRFQPFTMGHLSVIKQAFEHADNVLVLIGSAFAPPSHRNPFSYEQRADMIFASVGPLPLNLYCHALEDSLYNETQWLLDAQRAVANTLDDIAQTDGRDAAARRQMRVSLIGPNQYCSGYYANRFPDYDTIVAPFYRAVAAAPMRQAYFSNICEMWLNDCDGHRTGDRASEHLVPPEVRDFLLRFASTQAYRDIREEYAFIQRYRTRWVNAPYPVTMVTTDAMVIQSGHVLLVRRQGHPGLGLWALPGGYLPQDSSLLDGMVQNLLAETAIALDPDALRRAVVAVRAFDDPHRDPRGRVITHGFRLDLPASRKPPKIKPGRRLPAPDDLTPVAGGADGHSVRWVPLAALRRERLFADHHDIIKWLGGLN